MSQSEVLVTTQYAMGRTPSFDHRLYPLCLNQEHALMAREVVRRQTGLYPLDPLRTGFRVLGTLDVPALDAVLNKIVNRHDALRTALHRAPQVSPRARELAIRSFARSNLFVPGQYMQSVREGLHLSLRRFDLTKMDKTAQEERAGEILTEEVARPFDYVTEPLMRACLLKVGEDEHLLGIIVDHLFSDGWSMEIIRNEVQQLYPYFASDGPDPVLPPPGISPTDFAVWQNKMLSAGCIESVAYWRGQWIKCGGWRIPLQALPFHTVPSGNNVPSFAAEYLTVEPSSSTAIGAFARKNKVSMHTLFTAAYGLVLGAYMHRKKLALWGHFANRRGCEGADAAVGYFVNTHLLGIDLSGSPSGFELLDRVRSSIFGAFAHQEMPLPNLWNALKCHPRFADSMPLLDVTTTRVPTRQSAHAKRVAFCEARLPYPLCPRRSALGVYVSHDREQLSIRSVYLEGAFPPLTIRDMLTDILDTVICLVSHPEAAACGSESAEGRFRNPREWDAGEMSEFIVTGSGLLPDCGASSV